MVSHLANSLSLASVPSDSLRAVAVAVSVAGNEAAAYSISVILRGVIVRRIFERGVENDENSRSCATS